MKAAIRLARTLSLPLFIGGLSGSVAAPPPPLGSPPKHLTFNRYYRSSHLGYIMRAAYFTPAQIADPRWEAARMRVASNVRICRTSERIIHRDVVWYPVASRSGQQCGAIVYTVQCDVPNLAADGDLEQDRREALRFDADPPATGADCGEKDYTRKPQTRPISNEQLMARLLSPAAHCRAPDTSPANPIQLYSDSRLHFATEINPAFAAAHPQDPRYLVEVAHTGVANSFSRAELMLPRIRPSAIGNDGINILITETYAMNAAGRPYCVQLTARQGSRLWRRTISRNGFADYRLERAVRRDTRGLPRDSNAYWTPEIDLIRLAIEFGDGLARTADPVYRRDRASR
jgi:hypothetical protein